MNKWLIVLMMCGSTLCIAQTWQAAQVFPGGARDDAVGFAINNIGYVGTGMDLGFQHRTDFFRFHDDQWTQIPSMIGIGRQYTSSFSLNQSGCVVTGIAPNDSLLNEMQCFDPTTNAWAIKAPFPGAARLQAASFSVGDLGYCGLGRNFNTDFSDWYCYRAADNQWTAIAPFPVACHESVAFNIHGDGYVGLGKSMDGTTYNHFYRYNALTNTWTPIAPYPGVVRTYSIAFGIGGRGYVFSGMDENGGFSSEFWVYHPATDTWEQLPDFPFEKKRGVANFVANNCAHVVAGLSHNFQRLDAHEMYCATVPESDETFHLYPNPNTGGFAIFNKGSETIQQLSIIDVSGKVLYHNTQASSHVYIHQLNLLSGCYLVRITLSDQSHIVKKVVVTD